MKYYIFKQDAKRGDRPLKILNFEPNDFIIGELATQFGPIRIIPELIQVGPEKTTAEQTEEYIQSQLPAGVKTNWNP